MRMIRMLVALACVAAGVVVGALNPQRVLLDVGFATTTTTLGIAVLVALLIGVVVGGLVLTAGVVLPLQQRLRRAEAALSRPAPVRNDGH